MSQQLDHVFICCNLGAPEAAALREAGLLEGSSNTHPGQGTANRRFFFQNLFLELLWVSEPAESQSPTVLPTGLWEHWNRRKSGACPFGLVFRPGSDATTSAPFPTWSYHPAYLPSDLAIEVSVESLPTEPLLFYLPFARHRAAPTSEPTDHPAGIREIVSATLSLPTSSEPSTGLQMLVERGAIQLRSGADYHLELAFAGPRDASLDLRPVLPLSFVPVTN